jgi:hypothetical protein
MHDMDGSCWRKTDRESVPRRTDGGSSKVNAPPVLARYDAVTADARCSPERQTAVTCEGLYRLSFCMREVSG